MERKTRQRDLILSILKSENRPMSPMEILDLAQLEMPNIGIATVYRAIKDYMEAEQLSEVRLPGNTSRYALKHIDHYHQFWCRVCDRTYHVSGCPGQLNFQPPPNFKTEFHEVIFSGLCNDCSA